MSEFKVFKAAPGAGFNDEEAARIGVFLEGKVGLGKRPVAADEIVEAARPKRSPLHKRFEWDDSVAAAEHRRSQARHLVRHLVVTRESNGDMVETRAFHHVSVADTKGGYVSERVVWRDPDLSAQVVAKALAELRSWRMRYHEYSELQEAVRLVDEVLEAA